MTLPKISVWSQFRNAAGEQIARYRQQIEALDYPADLLRLYLCEGDSDDDTLTELAQWAATDARVKIVKHDTGIPHYSHSPRPERMRAVSENGNMGWDAIARDGWGEYGLMLESDLLYKPDLFERLVTRRPAKADIYSPMIWIQVKASIRFYDIWAYRIDGEKFQPTGPEYYYSKYHGRPFELDSVGSVVLIRMQLIHEGLRLGESDCILGMCNEARKRGYHIYCDPTIDVLHPNIQGVT
jgi:hypothetical protein